MGWHDEQGASMTRAINGSARRTGTPVTLPERWVDG